MEDIIACVYNVTLVKRKGMIPFSGLSRFSGLFDGDGPSPLNRDTTVLLMQENMTTILFFSISVDIFSVRKERCFA